MAEVVRLVAAADPSLAQIPQGHFLQVNLLRLMAGEDVQARLFADVLGGGRFASPLAERGADHAQDLRTRLVRRDGLLLLRGRKYYCTGASSARWLGVSALTETGRLVMARVPRDARGVAPGEDWSAMGQRATASGTTDFDDVPAEHALVSEYWRLFERPQLLGARAQLVHAAIEVGIAGGALRDGLDFVRARARPFFEAVAAGRARTAAEDPQTTRRAGRLAGRVRAAEELLRWAAGVLDDIGPWPADADEAAQGSVAVAQAKAFGSEVAVEVAGELFAMGGASATDRRWDLDRHWRNARTHSVHDPVNWKHHHVGAYLLSGTVPPNHGQI